jgi:hypothetical protein
MREETKGNSHHELKHPSQSQVKDFDMQKIYQTLPLTSRCNMQKIIESLPAAAGG